MARPNVTVTIDDQSFVITGSEAGSVSRGGMVSHKGLILATGYTAETKSGIMTIPSIDEWWSRLQTTEPVAEDYAENAHPNNAGVQMPAGGTYSRYPHGPTGEWKGEWWAVHNYLQYGGAAVIGATGTVENTSLPTTSNSPLHNRQIPLDSVFVGGEADGSVVGNDIETATNIAVTRKDCIAFVPHGQSGAAGAASADALEIGPDDGNSITVPASEFVSIIFGFKRHFGVNRNTKDQIDDLLITNCSADAAGCVARTDREFAPWYSPAGSNRGQILNVVRMVDTPTDSEQDSLYDNRVNPIVSFPGEGTILFGDKTTAVDTSTLSRINVSRLFIFLKKTVGAAARSKLFEFNDETTRSSFVNAVRPLLQTIKTNRGVYDYRVVCDETNNTPDIIDSNQFVADIFIKPAKSINFIRIRFTNKNTADDLG